MRRYIYSLVRCVPDPRTGEFVNVGAIAGDPLTGDWAVRQVSNLARATKFAGTPEPIEAALSFLTRLEFEIERTQRLFDETGQVPSPLDEDWLPRLHHDHRNVVQLSPPEPIIADNAREALAVLFEQLVIDPERTTRTHGITRQSVAAHIRESYFNADLVPLLTERAEIHVGQHIRAVVDFAVGNGHTVQLSQGWSFQILGLADLATQIKAWGYAVAGLRAGKNAFVLANGHRSEVDRNVDVEVVVAKPLSAVQEAAYEEASQVFADLDVNVRDLEDAHCVGERAAELMEQHG